MWFPVTIGVTVGLAVGVAALWAAATSAAGGHGTYSLAKVLFPLPMISTWWTGSISVAALIAAATQYPIVGILLGKLWDVGRTQFAACAGILAIMHLFAVWAAFRFGVESF